MKSFFSTLLMVALFATAGLAQQTTPDATAADATPTAGATMVFETETIDYGVIEQGSDPYRIFKFTNTGDAPLVIKHAKGSCGCTVPTYPKEPIMPGETNEIKVRYDTNRPGRFTKRVTLTLNTGDAQKILTIKGEVKKKAPEPDGVPASENGLFNGNNN